MVLELRVEAIIALPGLAVAAFLGATEALFAGGESELETFTAPRAEEMLSTIVVVMEVIVGSALLSGRTADGGEFDGSGNCNDEGCRWPWALMVCARSACSSSDAQTSSLGDLQTHRIHISTLFLSHDPFMNSSEATRT